MAEDTEWPLIGKTIYNKSEMMTNGHSEAYNNPVFQQDDLANEKHLYKWQDEWEYKMNEHILADIIYWS